MHGGWNIKAVIRTLDLRDFPCSISKIFWIAPRNLNFRVRIIVNGSSFELIEGNEVS